MGRRRGRGHSGHEDRLEAAFDQAYSAKELFKSKVSVDPSSSEICELTPHGNQRFSSPSSICDVAGQLMDLNCQHCQTNQQLVRLPASGMSGPCQRLLSAETKVDQIENEAWRSSRVETR